MDAQPTVVVVGAGPVGLTAAALLGRHGLSAVVIERRHGINPHPRARSVNVRTAEPVANPAAAIDDVITAHERELGEKGRVLVRASGTEALVRVMVEAESESTAVQVAGDLAGALVSRFGGHVEGSH